LNASLPSSEYRSLIVFACAENGSSASPQSQVGLASRVAALGPLEIRDLYQTVTI
jgi:hypothetical protein